MRLSHGYLPVRGKPLSRGVPCSVWAVPITQCWWRRRCQKKKKKGAPRSLQDYYVRDASQEPCHCHSSEAPRMGHRHQVDRYGITGPGWSLACVWGTRGGELAASGDLSAARAAYTVVNWMLLGCTGGVVDITELLKGGGSWVCHSVAGWRSGSNIYSVSLLRCRDVVLCWFLLPPRRVARVGRQW